MANPTTNYGFVLPTASDLVTDLPADFDVALQGVDTRLKALQPGTTLGDLAYSSSTANTNTRLGIGSTGQVLTVAGGVPTWATPAGGMTFIARTTFSNVATQAFDGVFTSTYKNYLVVIDQFSSVSGNAITMQLRYAGPTTQVTGYYGNNIYARANAATVTNDNTNNASTFKVLPTSGSASIPTRGYFYISGVGNASETANFNGMINDEQNSYGGSFNGCSTVARTYTGFIIQTATNITGTVSIYGLAAA